MGHESSVSPSFAAVCFGAVSVERHITLDRAMYGSDQAASLESVGFKSLVSMIRKLNKTYGDGIKRITDVEKTVASQYKAEILGSVKIYCFDIDGTICTNTNGDYENAKPYFINNLLQINTLYENNNKIIFLTARGSTTKIDWEEVTKNN